MGLNFRKRIKIAPGLNLNVGKRGLGVSAGPRGASVSISRRGVRTNVGIPGTGISYSKQISSRKKRPERVAYESVNKPNKLENSTIKQQVISEQASNIQQVEEYNAHVNMLTSVHLESEDFVDWHEFLIESSNFNEEVGPNGLQVKKEIELFNPSWRDKLFNRTEARKSIMNKKLDEARVLDQALFEEKIEIKELAKRVIAYDKEAWISALEKYNPFEDITNLGSKVVVKVNEKKELVVNLIIGNEQVVPKEVLTLTSTKKLSKKEMLKTRYLLLYQDYVCSCVIRIAREVFAILPAEKVQINVYDFSQADEPPIKGCILSTIIERNNLDNIIFEAIDCSETIETFQHNMKYLKTKGFRIVEEIS